jgi:hypothetical protein
MLANWRLPYHCHHAAPREVPHTAHTHPGGGGAKRGRQTGTRRQTDRQTGFKLDIQMTHRQPNRQIGRRQIAIETNGRQMVRIQIGQTGVYCTLINRQADGHTDRQTD